MERQQTHSGTVIICQILQIADIVDRLKTTDSGFDHCSSKNFKHIAVLMILYITDRSKAILL